MEQMDTSLFYENKFLERNLRLALHMKFKPHCELSFPLRVFLCFYLEFRTRNCLTNFLLAFVCIVFPLPNDQELRLVELNHCLLCHRICPSLFGQNYLLNLVFYNRNLKHFARLVTTVKTLWF